MKIEKQLEKVNEELRKLLLSGHNFLIIADIRRSQVTYLKVIRNSDMKRINFKQVEIDEKSIGSN